MQIQIRAAMARDYEAAVKILSQVQDMHVEGPSHTTRDLIFVDRMAVDEAYRGAGVGHKMFDFLKGLKRKKIWTPLSCRSTQKIRRRMKCIENTALQKNPSIWSCWNHKKRFPRK